MSLKHALVVVGIVVAGTGTGMAGLDEWTNAGLYGGDANFVTYNPATETVYSGNRTQGFLRRGISDAAWQPETANQEISIGGLIVDPFDSATLYRIDGDELVLKSTDGGDTWAPSATGIPSTSYVGDIAAAPSAQDVLYAGGLAGDMWKSTDGAASWTPAGNVGGAVGHTIRVIAVHPTDPDTVFAASYGGVFFTDDGGATWTPRGAGIRPERTVEILFDPHDHSRVYLASEWDGLNVTQDLGVSGWTFKSTGHNSARSLAVAPSNPTTIYYGSIEGVFVSTDAGESFVGPASGLTTPETWGLAADPTDASRVWAATVLGGVFQSTDGGQTFTEWNTGNETERVRALEMDPTTPGRFWAATGDGVGRTTDGGATWTNHRHMYWWGTPVYAMGMSRSDPDVLYADSGVTARSVDGGDTFELVQNGICDSSIVDFAVHPTNPDVVYATGLNIEVCKSITGGASWFESWSGIPDGSSGNAVVIDPTDPDVLYVGTGHNGIFRSDDAGASWVQLPATVDTDVPNVCVDPTDSSRILAITDWVVYLSEDTGQTWIDVSPPGDLNFQDCEIGPGGEMLVGSIGTNLVSVWGTYIHRSFDHGATWQELEGAPIGRVQDIRIDPFNRGRILVGLR
ncbi:MAG: hypothetical protein V2I67_03510, partial [Thermoanaerobaculales bacterium]|nr:hypothetical protein [Thermoanaerobaculales bacterium]